MKASRKACYELMQRINELHHVFDDEAGGLYIVAESGGIKLFRFHDEEPEQLLPVSKTNDVYLYLLGMMRENEFMAISRKQRG